MDSVDDVRIDKWLWAVRVFKTRSLASEACRAGHVKIAGQAVKPSHSVKVGEVITAQVGIICRMVKVAALLGRRVGSKAVAQFLEDLTPPEEYQKRQELSQQPLLLRAKGQGRPTKRDRRLIHPFLAGAESE